MSSMMPVPSPVRITEAPRQAVSAPRRDTGADATLRIDGTSRPLPAEASLALFRGAQEALTNITRYAPAPPPPSP